MNFNLEKYHIDINLIKKHIEEAAVKKHQDKSLPKEIFTKDMLETYSDFAESKMGIKFNLETNRRPTSKSKKMKSLFMGVCEYQ